MRICACKVCHTNEQVEGGTHDDVDLGGTVLNVTVVNHRVYGRVEAALNIRTGGMQGFLNDLRTGKSVPLLNVTSGYHFHKDFRGKRRSARRDRACTCRKGLSGGSDALRAGDMPKRHDMYD